MNIFLLADSKETAFNCFDGVRNVMRGIRREKETVFHAIEMQMLVKNKERLCVCVRVCVWE